MRKSIFQRIDCVNIFASPTGCPAFPMVLGTNLKQAIKECSSDRNFLNEDNFFNCIERLWTFLLHCARMYLSFFRWTGWANTESDLSQETVGLGMAMSWELIKDEPIQVNTVQVKNYVLA